MFNKHSQFTFHWPVLILISVFSVYYGIQLERKLYNQEQLPLKGEVDGEQNSSHIFKYSSYYVVDDQKPTLLLFSNTMDIDQENALITILRPNGVIYNKKGERTYYESDAGSYFTDRGDLIMNNNAKVKKDISYAKANRIDFIKKTETFHLRENVNTYKRFYQNDRNGNVNRNLYDELWVDSDYATFQQIEEQITYKDNVKGEIVPKFKWQPTTFFWTDTLLGYLNKSYIELIGNARIYRNNVDATGRRGEIFLDNQTKKLKFYALYDDVKLKQEITALNNDNSKKIIVRKAFGEILEGHAKENKIILLGLPKVYQENDLIKGNKITLLQNSDVIIVDDSHSRFKVK